MSENDDGKWKVIEDFGSVEADRGGTIRVVVSAPGGKAPGSLVLSRQNKEGEYRKIGGMSKKEAVAVLPLLAKAVESENLR